MQSASLLVLIAKHQTIKPYIFGSSIILPVKKKIKII